MRNKLCADVLTEGLVAPVAMSAASTVEIFQCNCEKWITARTAKNTVDDWQAQAWIFGYLAGAAVWSTAAGNPAKGTDPKDVTEAVYAHCLQHPADRLSDASDAFIRERVASAGGDRRAGIAR